MVSEQLAPFTMRAKRRIPCSQLNSRNVPSHETREEMKNADHPLYLNGKDVNFKGKVVTGDAMCCQTCFCRAIHEAGGVYAFVLKDNQPSMLKDVQLFMADLKECDTKQARSGHAALNFNSRHPDDHERLTTL